MPFLIDVTGNSLDLYDSVVWWDDFNHFVNWVFLCLGLALVIVPRLRPPWVLVTLVTGFGCILALGWELGEWYTFIRHGTELDTAYEDTLGDMTLGTLGVACRRVAGAPARPIHGSSGLSRPGSRARHRSWCPGRGRCARRCRRAGRRAAPGSTP